MDVYMNGISLDINEHKIYCIKRHKSGKIGSSCERIIYTTPYIRNKLPVSFFLVRMLILLEV